jgi:hypothetical protein
VRGEVAFHAVNCQGPGTMGQQSWIMGPGAGPTDHVRIYLQSDLLSERCTSRTCPPIKAIYFQSDLLLAHLLSERSLCIYNIDTTIYTYICFGSFVQGCPASMARDQAWRIFSALCCPKPGITTPLAQQTRPCMSLRAHLFPLRC